MDLAAPTLLLPARRVPRLPRLPVLGNLLDLHRDRLGLLRRVLDELGEAGAFHLGPRPVYAFTSPAYAASVLVDNWEAFEKGPMLRRFARPFIGDGIVSCLNDAHPRKRRLAAPGFSRRHIAGYVASMGETAVSATASWRTGQRLDLYVEMKRLTMQVICRTLFSMDANREAAGFVAALDVAMDYISARLRHPLHLPLSIPTRNNRRVRRAVRRMDAFIADVIARRRARPADTGDMLQVLLDYRDDSGDALTDAEVLDDLKALFAAGFETTANTLAFAWGFLAHRPALGRRVRAEVDAAIGDRLPALEDLLRMPYTLQVLRETLRIYPPAHTIGRQASRPVSVGSFQLPRGAIVLVSPYMMHRRSEVFPDPERFDPERFAPDAFKALPKHAYIPFGVGPRSCLGAHFGLIEAQVVLATLARRFDFEPLGSEPRPEPLLTLRPAGGVPVFVRRRG